MSRVAVIGAGGHARVIISILKSHRIEIMGVFDDSCGQIGELIQEVPVIGPFLEILKYGHLLTAVYLAIGDNQDRYKWHEFLSLNHFELPSLIHPRAIVERDATVGSASSVCVGAIVCTQAVIGRGCIINTGCSIDHESSIGDFSHLAPGVVVAGRTQIGSNTFIGLNSAIANKIRIGNNVIIGAGSVVLSDIPDGARIVGVYK
jgi:sugar O-acyltransferase (sialic acid O-acetyltransferase NeuD family)